MHNENGDGGLPALAGGVRGVQPATDDPLRPGPGPYGQGMAMAGPTHSWPSQGHPAAAPVHDPAPVPHSVQPAQPIAADIDFQAGRNFMLGKRRLRRGVLGALVKDAKKKKLPVPAFDELLERAVVRFVDSHGNFVDVGRALITFED